MNPRRVTRFALVLNGGVSLAVWMGGVTHELNRLRLASASPSQRPAEAEEAAVHDAWVTILDAANRKAVVDTVAGTSAGGLNGSLLATAIAGGKDLPYMKCTWANVAALRPGQLLREPMRHPEQNGEHSKSILNGHFFHQEVQKLLTGISEGDSVTEPQDCTLLVTATAVDAQPVHIRLEGGTKATLMDSRRVFRFERRTDDRGHVRDDFAKSCDCIALASRASASFPVAFEPVEETDDLHTYQISPVGSKQKSLLIDGGVLDNAPFGPLMEVLRSRPIGAPFDRVLLYITPSPGISTVPPNSNDNRSVLRVLGRVVSAAREPDQRLDFEGLHHAYTRMGFSLSAPHDAITRLLLSPNPKAFIDTSEAALAAGNWFTTYRYSRAEAAERELEALDGEIRFVAPAPTALSPDELRSVPTDLNYSGNEWRWGLATAERALRWWGRALVAYSKVRNFGSAAEPTFQEIQQAQRRVARLREELVAHMHDDDHVSLQSRAARMNAFYTIEIDKEFREALEGAANAIAGLPGLSAITACSLINFTLAVEVASAALSWSNTSEEDTPQLEYHQVTPAAEPLIDVGKALTTPDWLRRKLYGERWGHFGAFATSRGRNADWLWGRLDGASALCDHLLKGVLTAQELKENLADAILLAEGSSKDKLSKAVTEAVETSGTELLQHMKPAERRDTARLLWRQTLMVLADSAPDTAHAQNIARAFADPTWTAKDLREPTSRRALASARLVRIYGWPVRRLVQQRIRKYLDT